MSENVNQPKEGDLVLGTSSPEVKAQVQEIISKQIAVDKDGYHPLNDDEILLSFNDKTIYKVKVFITESKQNIRNTLENHSTYIRNIKDSIDKEITGSFNPSTVDLTYTDEKDVQVLNPSNNRGWQKGKVRIRADVKIKADSAKSVTIIDSQINIDFKLTE